MIELQRCTEEEYCEQSSANIIFLLVSQNYALMRKDCYHETRICLIFIVYVQVWENQGNVGFYFCGWWPIQGDPINTAMIRTEFPWAAELPFVRAEMPDQMVQFYS